MAKVVMTFMVDPLMKAMVMQTAKDMGISQGWVIRTALQDFFDGGQLSPTAQRQLAKMREQMENGFLTGLGAENG